MPTNSPRSKSTGVQFVRKRKLKLGRHAGVGAVGSAVDLVGEARKVIRVRPCRGVLGRDDETGGNVRPVAVIVPLAGRLLHKLHAAAIRRLGHDAVSTAPADRVDLAMAMLFGERCSWCDGGHYPPRPASAK